MYANILLGAQKNVYQGFQFLKPWSIFLFLKFYNLIKEIMRIHSIFKKAKTNIFIPHLLTF